jgi:DNA-binding NtrC family response regulator
MAKPRLLAIKSLPATAPPCVRQIQPPLNWTLRCTDQPPESSELTNEPPQAIAVVHECLEQRTRTLQCIRDFRAACRATPILLLSAEGSENFVIEAFHAGASRYLKPPWTAVLLRSALDELAPQQPGPPLDESGPTACLIGNSRATSELKAYLRQIAPCESNVLITGETGTGKELIAQVIHQGSLRSGEVLVCLNSVAIPDSLVESELFGYEKGAFTGAHSSQPGKLSAANNGTVFFDEIGDVSLTVQAKLLRAIETKKIYRLGGSRQEDLNIRILAATNHDLDVATLEHRFRADLYYRLNVIHVPVPPLRDRVEDVFPLVTHYVRHFNATFHRAVTGFTREAINLLQAYLWPGNVRELRNVIEAVFANLPAGAGGDVGLPRVIQDRLKRAALTPAGERTSIVRALTATKGNKSEAARALQCSRMTLYRKMARYAIQDGPEH